MAKKTRIERSLFLMTPISPVRNARIPDAPASNIGIVNTRSLKSNVSSPRWPEVTISMNVTKNTTKAPMNPVDHLPIGVFGKILTRMPLLWTSVGHMSIDGLLIALAWDLCLNAGRKHHPRRNRRSVRSLNIMTNCSTT